MRLVRRGCGESRLLTIAVFVRGSPGIRLFDELVMDSSCISHMIADHMPRGESGRLGWQRTRYAGTGGWSLGVAALGSSQKVFKKWYTVPERGPVLLRFLVRNHCWTARRNAYHSGTTIYVAVSILLVLSGFLIKGGAGLLLHYIGYNGSTPLYTDAPYLDRTQNKQKKHWFDHWDDIMNLDRALRRLPTMVEWEACGNGNVMHDIHSATVRFDRLRNHHSGIADYVHVYITWAAYWYHSDCCCFNRSIDKTYFTMIALQRLSFRNDWWLSAYYRSGKWAGPIEVPVRRHY